MIRAVLDANVVVSGVLSGKGYPGRILAAWRDEQFHLVISEAILEEIGRVLRYPRIATRHQWNDAQLRVFIEDLTHVAILTPGELTLSAIAEDPSDNRYLECAVEGDADYIVSGDHHLLNLAHYRGIEILTPRSFVEMHGSLWRLEGTTAASRCQ